MPRQLLTIHDLQPGKLYDKVGNQHPNHILYFVDEHGCLWHKDIIVNTQHPSTQEYNIVIKERFYETF